jgi:hypothetical protein
MIEVTVPDHPVEAGAGEHSNVAQYTLRSSLIDADIDEFMALTKLRAKVQLGLYHNRKGLNGFCVCQGWKDERMDTHFEKQRYNADHASDELSHHWFQKMKGVFKEIDAKSECVQRTDSMFFLDLGFACVELLFRLFTYEKPRQMLSGRFHVLYS